jgi:hypothetical protein
VLTGPDHQRAIRDEWAVPTKHVSAIPLNLSLYF